MKFFQVFENLFKQVHLNENVAAAAESMQEKLVSNFETVKDLNENYVTTDHHRPSKVGKIETDGSRKPTQRIFSTGAGEAYSTGNGAPASGGNTAGQKI